jgi:hypothetical protein
VNLHGIVAKSVGAVNPMVTASVKISTGYTTAADGERTPGYATPVPATVQVQALQASELALVEGLNIQGIKRAVYLNGRWDGLVRPTKKGGDLITMLNGDIWLVIVVLEYWPDWCKVAVVLQNGS